MFRRPISTGLWIRFETGSNFGSPDLFGSGYAGLGESARELDSTVALALRSRGRRKKSAFFRDWPSGLGREVSCLLWTASAAGYLAHPERFVRHPPDLSVAG
jgi:hypothetical protein